MATFQGSIPRLPLPPHHRLILKDGPMLCTEQAAQDFYCMPMLPGSFQMPTEELCPRWLWANIIQTQRSWTPFHLKHFPGCIALDQLFNLVWSQTSVFSSVKWASWCTFYFYVRFLLFLFLVFLGWSIYHRLHTQEVTPMNAIFFPLSFTLTTILFFLFIYLKKNGERCRFLIALLFQENGELPSVHLTEGQ